MQSASTMSMTVFEQLVGSLGRASAHIVKFHLNWRGEPASNPYLANMLALLVDKPWDVEWHTNATLLQPRKASEIIAANPHHSVYLSLDGGTASSFERNRGAGTWEKALRGAEALLAARGDRPWPRIGVYQLDLGVPPEQWDPRFRSILAKVDSHTIVPPVDVDGGSLNRDAGATVPRGPCFWLGNTFAIDVHGQAWTCLLGTGTRLGSLLTESADDLIDRAERLRASVERETRAAVPGCSTCYKMEGRARRPEASAARLS
jgi:sulfatase maturation enzyme AslB (radical SAM superfamily)